MKIRAQTPDRTKLLLIDNELNQSIADQELKSLEILLLQPTASSILQFLYVISTFS